MGSIRPNRTKSVLVVDDDADALEEMTEALRDQGLTVHGASTGAAALAVAYRHRAAFVIMDYKLPGANGLETVSAMRRFLPKAKVIMISASGRFCKRATTKNTGAFAILKKPLSIESIARYIRNRLEYESANPDLAGWLAA